MPRIPGPCAVVIFGVTGDLARKKLMPAIYDLANRGLLPPSFSLVGFARRDWKDEDFAKIVHDSVCQHARTPFRQEVWDRLAEGFRFVQGTFDDPASFTSPDFVGRDAASLFTRDGTPLSGPDGIQAGGLRAPQGIAVDQRGDVWIANHVGNSVTLYPGGDPGQARLITGGGLYKPFAVEVDGAGNVWVGNGAIDAQARLGS